MSFTTEQQEYLKGFFFGLSQRTGIPFLGETPEGKFTAAPSTAPSNLAEETIYGTLIEDLCREERIKYEHHGLDVWNTILDNAARDKFPEGGDVFRYKFHGLFYVSPAQESLMLRCRMPGCVLRADQLEAIADIAGDWGGGYSHITTRGNLQIREIMPRDSVDVLLKLRDVGLTSQGSGADNIRNITASPTSGFDPDEVLDVLPHARAMHHYILNNQDMYDLPRKFNIAFDIGGGVDQDQGMAREVFNSVSFTEVPALLARLLTGYFETRRTGETFVAFARRHSVTELAELASKPWLGLAVPVRRGDILSPESAASEARELMLNP